MSYEVVSDKLSICLDGKNYLSFLYAGCNNLVNDNGGVVKSWSAVPVAYGRAGCDAPWATVNEMKRVLAEYKQELLREYPDEFDGGKSYGLINGISIGGRRTDKTSFGQYQGLWVGAAKKAITVSTLRKIAGVRITVRVSPFYANKHGIEPRTCTPNTGKELMRVYSEFRKNPNGGEDVPVYIEIQHASQDLAKDIRRVLFCTKKPEQDAYVITYGSNGFVSSVSSFGIGFSPKDPVFYTSRDVAREVVKECKGHFSHVGFVALRCPAAAA